MSHIFSNSFYLLFVWERYVDLFFCISISTSTYTCKLCITIKMEMKCKYILRIFIIDNTDLPNMLIYQIKCCTPLGNILDLRCMWKQSGARWMWWMSVWTNRDKSAIGYSLPETVWLAQEQYHWFFLRSGSLEFSIYTAWKLWRQCICGVLSVLKSGLNLFFGVAGIKCMFSENWEL